MCVAAVVLTQADAPLCDIVPHKVGVVLRALVLANDGKGCRAEDGVDGGGIGWVYFCLDLDLEYLAGLDRAYRQDFVEQVFFAVGEEGVDVAGNPPSVAQNCRLVERQQRAIAHQDATSDNRVAHIAGVTGIHELVVDGVCGVGVCR